MSAVPPFNGNDYRKKVLAAVEARGGPSTADPFELYDLPLDAADQLTDAEVEARINEVWAFWQKQRDHPKYRGLVTALLDDHDELKRRLVNIDGRREVAARAREFRTERDAGRFNELDAAVSRLVARFGGLPRGKVAGLQSFAARAGIDEAEFQRRIRRHRLIDDAPPIPAAAASTEDLTAVYRQVRADLDELGRLTSEARPASLYDLIGLPPGAARQRVKSQRDALAARNRERRPDRRRALIDDLLAAVTALLVDGDADAYLDALMAEVAERLRPRVAAAILVEDSLTPEDHGHLLAEAEAGGLDRARAVRLLAQLARENGVTAPDPGMQPVPPEPTARPAGSTGTPSAAAWQEELSRARAALRSGQLLTARRHAEAARQRAGEMLPPIRAVSDEIEALYVAAAGWWRAADQAVAAQLLTSAATWLERLVAAARDIPSAAGERADIVLGRVRDQLAELDRRVEAARALGGSAAERALLEVVASAPDHPGAKAALASIPVAPATEVRARRVNGGVSISWRASTSVGPVNYRVLRQDSAGSLQPLGSTAGTDFETALHFGMTPPDASLPVFVVIARRNGIESVPASSAQVIPASPGRPAKAPRVAESASAHRVLQPPVTSSGVTLTPVTELSVQPHGHRLRLSFPPPAAGRAEVRRLRPGTAPPAVGLVLADLDAVGDRIPPAAPGLAMDRRPAEPVTIYVVFTVDGTGRSGAVAGAAAAMVQAPAASDLALSGDRLTWNWPVGCTEAVVAWRTDAPPTGPADRNATSRKLTNSRYQIDGGLVLPESRPLYVAVFGCIRVGSTLHVGSVVHPSASAVFTR